MKSAQARKSSCNSIIACFWKNEYFAAQKALSMRGKAAAQNNVPPPSTVPGNWNTRNLPTQPFGQAAGTKYKINGNLIFFLIWLGKINKETNGNSNFGHFHLGCLWKKIDVITSLNSRDCYFPIKKIRDGNKGAFEIISNHSHLINKYNRGIVEYKVELSLANGSIFVEYKLD